MIFSNLANFKNHYHILNKIKLLNNVKKFVQTRSITNQDIIDYLSNYPNNYSSQHIEKFWSSVWEHNELFVNKKSNSLPTFRILLPPPNITGSLHLGHALTVSIQDALCRFFRMNGEHVHWFGGTDHAGIATQIIIEKILWNQQGKTRKNVSRQEFEELFEKWKNERSNEIVQQLKSLGASIDFKSNYFTLSPEISDIVKDAFIELFNRNMIYRATYMVNWSYYLQSTLSDIEIEHKYISGPTEYTVPGCDTSFQLGVMHYFKYPIEHLDSNEFVEVATTRIESLMGDVALCVHPDDIRHSHLVGKFAFNPFTNEKMPILADPVVKPDFGTGVLKLTPAHSAIDYEIATRHQLSTSKIIFNDIGFINCQYEPLNNVHRYAAKELVKNELEKRGLYCGFKEHGHWLPICLRSGDIIESRLVPQWFLKTGDSRYITEFVGNRDNLSESSAQIWNKLKQNLDEDSKNMSIIPSGNRNTWKDWFSRYKDWCISRQIFWGHQIPAYEIVEQSKSTDIWIAAKSEEEAADIACNKHGFNKNNITLRQEKDVLDTWFSSALLPLIVTGWFRGKTFNDLPLSIMETGHDIMFFWVARMALLSLMLTNRLPFNKVLLHGMICDKNGRKMSKSKANVIDPNYIINGISLDGLIKQNKEYLKSGIITNEKYTENLNELLRDHKKGIPACGADTLRLSLLQTRFKDYNVKYDFLTAVKNRIIPNKMHHTVRFILMNIRPEFREMPLNIDELTNLDKWILAKLSTIIEKCRFSFKSYDLNNSVRSINQFWRNELSKIYLQSVKKDFNNNENYLRSMNVLIFVIRQSLKCLHPFAPFLTEDLYQKINYNIAMVSNNAYLYKSILDEEYPNIKTDPVLKYFNNSYLNDMERMKKIIKGIRSMKNKLLLEKSDQIIENVKIASLYDNLSDYLQFIHNNINLDLCTINFINLYDIYKYDDCYCIKIDNVEEQVATDENSDSELEEESKTSNESNSLEANEIYLLFTINTDKLREKFANNIILKNKVTKMESILNELDSIHFKNFTKNYKHLTKIIS